MGQRTLRQQRSLDMKFPSKFHILFLGLAILVCTMSLPVRASSGFFLIRATGGLGDTGFDILSPSGGPINSSDRIMELAVQRRQADGWKTLWIIRGRGFARSIRYGTVPDGMREEFRPVALVKGYVYRVFGTAESAQAPYLYSTLYFSFDAKGRVKQVSPIP